MNTTLHIPIDANVRKKLDEKAKRLGFDSVQAYIRVWAKADVEDRIISFGDSWEQPTDAAVARINIDAEDALNGLNLSESFCTVEDFMKSLRV